MKPHEQIPLDQIYAARGRIKDCVVRSPLLPLNLESTPAKIYLKLENLQPINSFKLRGASNAIAVAPKEQLACGVYTASAGNAAQGLGWNAWRLGLPCTIVVPDTAPQNKLEAIKRLGAKILKVSYSEWWQVRIDHGYAPLKGQLYVDPASDSAVMAGNGTIGLEILEDLPDVDAVVIPWGSGGLSCGIASAVRALKPDTRIYACEVTTAAPLAASFAAGRPAAVEYLPSFVDGIGAKGVLEEMWPLASSLLEGSLVMTLAEVAAAIRLLVERNRIVAEGAGATPVAAALAGKAGEGKVVCVVSGGNIDSEKLVAILQGQVPD
ncbi:MAG: threonine/serine dehydratase [Acidobacteriota bacterium]